MNLKKIARNLVKKSLHIRLKPNPGIAKARKKYGAVIDKIIKKRYIDPKKIKNKKLLQQLKNPLYGPLLVEMDGKLFVKKQIGELVRLVYSEIDPTCIKLAKEIKRAVWAIGAHITDTTYSSSESRAQLQLIPWHTAAELSEPSRILARTYDMRIFLGGDEDINWMAGLEKKAKLGAPASMILHQIMDKRKMRWCLFGWPVPQKKYFVPKNIYRKVFLNSIAATFKPKVRQLCDYYKKALSCADKIRIVADDGTDLEFSIKGRPILVADGIIDADDIKHGDVGLNIPDGEVFVAPLERSANGTIIFDYVAIHGFGFIRKLKITFKNGRVVDYSAPGGGAKIFKRFLDTNIGEKDRIAELGIGTNPAAQFIGETIVDEKIFGSIHIAIGDNSGAYHGKNKASSHLDMIKIMRNGKMFVDGRLVMDNGQPVSKKSNTH